MHQAAISSRRRPDEVATEILVVCTGCKWRREVLIYDAVEMYRDHVMRQGVAAVFEAGMAFEQHLREEAK